MSDDLLNRLTYFAFKLEGKGQLESAASDAVAEAAERLSAHSTAIDGLRAENERLRAANKQLVDGIETITRRKQEEIERLRAALRDFACACSSIRECESLWEKDYYCLHLNARKALEGKP